MIGPQFGIREYLSRIPTADLYVLNPVRHLRRHSVRAARLPRIRCLVPNVYAIGSTGVIVRYAAAEDLDLLRRSGARRILYVADDDFVAGAADASLPDRYRAKLAAFAGGAWPVIREAADIVIVPGSVLASQYGAKARILSPVWHRPPAATAHFEAAGQIEVVHLGTGSHVSDIAAIAAPLAAVLQAKENVRLTLFSAGPAPGPLQRCANVRLRRPMPWWRYKLMLPRMRFHLALYPLRDTAFNRARSSNKLFEHALVGAASLMSPMPALCDAAGDASSPVFVRGGEEEWRQRIEADLSDMQALRRRADAIRSHIVAADLPGRAVEEWLDMLGL